MTDRSAATPECHRLTEWEFSEPVQLTDRDHEYIIQEVNRNDSGESVTKLAIKPHSSKGVKIKPRRHAGIVKLPSGTVLRIDPKVSNTALINMLRYSVETLPTIRSNNTKYETEDNGLVYLLAHIYSEILDRVLRAGVKPEYVDAEERHRKLRGRLNIQRQLQIQGPKPTQFECEYSELSYDSPLNQSLLHAAVLLTKFVEFDELGRRLSRQITRLRDVGVTKRVVHEQELNGLSTATRRMTVYHQALTLARMVIKQSALSSIDSGAGTGATFLINMDELFESVVRDTVKTVVKREQSSATKREIGHIATRVSDGTPLGRVMQPDIVIERDGDVVGVVDAKWKDTSSVEKTDIYQMLAYTTKTDSPGALIFPSSPEQSEDLYKLLGSNQLTLVGLQLESADYETFVDEIEGVIERQLLPLI